MRLYELTTEYQRLADVLIADDGELQEDVNAMLAAIEGDIKDKANGICSLVQNFRRQAEAADAEVKRLQLLASTRWNAVDRLKAYLLNNLQAMNTRKIETDKFVVRQQKNSRPSIRWEPGDATPIPDAYQRVTVELDGVKAYADWKAGQLPGAFSVKQGVHLVIQ